jgi:hypothetical protein
MKKALLTLSALALCVSAGSALAKEYKELRFGVDPSYAPFESKAADGSLVGFDVDLGNAICAELKVKCKWVESDFDGMIPGLKANKFDGVISSMTVRPRPVKKSSTSPASCSPARPLTCPRKVPAYHSRRRFAERQNRRLRARHHPGSLRQSRSGQGGRENPGLSEPGPGVFRPDFRPSRCRHPGHAASRTGLPEVATMAPIMKSASRSTANCCQPKQRSVLRKVTPS